jgi:hypothetical protein
VGNVHYTGSNSAGRKIVMKIASRDDWKTEPLPSTSKLISVDLNYSTSEFEKIIIGTIPEEMEDKWFIFYEEPWLYIHRSWTGFCVFKVRFEIFDDRAKIVKVWVNRDPKQYKETEDIRDASLLKILLDYRAGYNTVSQILSYVKSVSKNTEQ